jgi:hypothetical protein
LVDSSSPVAAAVVEAWGSATVVAEPSSDGFVVRLVTAA